MKNKPIKDTSVKTDAGEKIDMKKNMCTEWTEFNKFL